MSERRSLTRSSRVRISLRSGNSGLRPDPTVLIDSPQFTPISGTLQRKPLIKSSLSSPSVMFKYLILTSCLAALYPLYTLAYTNPRSYELIVHRFANTGVCSVIHVGETQHHRRLGSNSNSFVTEVSVVGTHDGNGTMESIRIFAHSEDVLWGRIGPICESYDKLDFSAFVRRTAPSAFRSNDFQTILSTLPVLGQPGDVFELPLDVQRISDGYLASEKDKFIADVRRLVVEISVNQTFQTVAPLLNFWAAFTPSNEVTFASLPFFHSTFVVDLTALRRAASASAGYRKSEGPSSHDADSIPVLNMNISTPFGLYRDGTELRALYYSKPDIARAACNSLGDRCNYPILIGNDPLYGGLGGEFTTITSSIVNAALILRHELGHSVIGVGEEYDGGFAYFGVDAGFNASEPMPWAHWLSPANSSSDGLPRVERVVMPLQDYAWALLNTTTPWSASFNSSGTYTRYLVRFSLSGLPEKGDLSVLLDGDDLGWTPKEGLGVDRYFYDIYRDDALSEGGHIVEFVLKNGEREGIAQMCSVEILEYGNEEEFKAAPRFYGVFPT
ncbi:hypothetical protein EW146_g9760 [Bondarzewia mesenterica]|uniref:IgA peptidase M64-domain-containing protein n=1 Tax=Bondarzewia mesenterica TaxID=1095465 RepID=A0A4S4L423_9AGAM|nr:hypothetical protein EW146_g9760 [Bondarzewia mesenterica]